MRRRADRGAAVVEFALVVPLVLVLLLGVLEYAWQYWARETAAAAAREAARRLIVGTDPACTVEAARSFASGPDVSGDGPEVTYSYDTGTAARGALVTVTVTMHSLDVGLVPIPDGGVVVETATNRVENVPADPLDCLEP